MKSLCVFLLLSGLWISCGDTSPEQRVHRILTERMQTLSTAESCTGGTIAARFTAMPGASAYFRGGIVAYCNALKNNLLSVPVDTIARYGVVSEQVARQMAEGVRLITSAHYTVATTGIAGPTGGTPEQPIGTVWIAVSSPTRTSSRLLHANGDRTAIIRQTGTEAILLLEKMLDEEQ